MYPIIVPRGLPKIGWQVRVLFSTLLGNRGQHMWSIAQSVSYWHYIPVPRRSLQVIVKGNTVSGLQPRPTPHS